MDESDFLRIVIDVFLVLLVILSLPIFFPVYIIAGIIYFYKKSKISNSQAMPILFEPKLR